MRSRETSDQEAPPVEPTWRGKAVGNESGISRAFWNSQVWVGKAAWRGLCVSLAPCPTPLSLNKVVWYPPVLPLRQGT